MQNSKHEEGDSPNQDEYQGDEQPQYVAISGALAD